MEPSTARPIVKITSIRVADAVIGDVVNRDPHSNRGWFEIDNIEPLHDGSWALLNDATNTSITAGPLDIVGLQVLKTISFD